MKKTTKKLALSKTTIRRLSDELGQVQGGGDSAEGLRTVLKDLVPFTSNCPKSGYCADGD
jgi:hypothetical protein